MDIVTLAASSRALLTRCLGHTPCTASSSTLSSGRLKVCIISTLLPLAKAHIPCSGFDNDHMRFWGQQYQAEDVVLEWHGKWRSRLSPGMHLTSLQFRTTAKSSLSWISWIRSSHRRLIPWRKSWTCRLGMKWLVMIFAGKDVSLVSGNTG